MSLQLCESGVGEGAGSGGQRAARREWTSC